MASPVSCCPRSQHLFLFVESRTVAQSATKRAEEDHRAVGTFDDISGCGFRVRMEIRDAVSRGALHIWGRHHQCDVVGFPLVGRYSLVASAIVQGPSTFALVSFCVVSLVCIPLPWRAPVTFAPKRNSETKVRNHGWRNIAIALVDPVFGVTPVPLICENKEGHAICCPLSCCSYVVKRIRDLPGEPILVSTCKNELLPIGDTLL
jgi:hypothetical protein